MLGERDNHYTMESMQVNISVQLYKMATYIIGVYHMHSHISDSQPASASL